jgi:uncharacterized protein (DUF2236 family)
MTPAGDGLFPPASAIRRVWGHPAVMLGGGRALLLQIAHPGVARGVIEHSDFTRDPFGRLQRTLNAVDRIVWGSAEEAMATAARLRGVHAHVQGEGYDATDPALVLWVHATLVDTALRMHERWVAPVPPAVADAFYAQAMVVGELFGAPRREQPADLAAFRAYMRGMVADLGPRIGDAQRRLAHRVLHPSVPLAADPVVLLGRQLTVGQLPRPVREGFRLRWDLPREAALQATGLGTRLLNAPLALARRVAAA